MVFAICQHDLAIGIHVPSLLNHPLQPPSHPWLFCCSSLFSSEHYLYSQWLSQNMLIDSMRDLMFAWWFFCFSLQPSFSFWSWYSSPVPLTWLLVQSASWTNELLRAERRSDPCGSHNYMGQQWNQSPLASTPVFAPHQHIAYSVSVGTSLLDQRRPVPSSLKTSLMFYGKIT